MQGDDSPYDGVQVGRNAGDATPGPRASVAIGFGSPASDSGVTRLDLNDILVKHPQATFLMRAAGSAMREAGIDGGDLLLIDRAVAPAHGHVVIAVVEHEFICRRLVQRPGELRLRAADPAVADIVPAPGEGLEIWGVVTRAIKSLPV
ncbi:MAG: translesion error-prone DNA polymerase V autoproteolytic subunit [Piscinibacter sp.]|uniref:LexA family protein n=1 Tax=Piscinibacter sp. TaxID=1903157 RepID=UPI00258E0DB9|nr:translesion error-prone DNA polymerase V autoproteolytic subunit [Piscinibacter sp.]MCW5662817.1 translesion error-prone DNA polymerase V autoproteolytic subunit [Piscinibacter sp.]